LCTCADCKLATKDNMDHIDHHGGRIVSVLPASRKEDAAFRSWLVTHEATWTEAMRRRGRRHADPDDVYATCEAPWPSAEGYRVVWVRSSAKIERDAESRRRRIAEGITALDCLNQRLASAKTRMKTILAVETAAREALEHAGAACWVTFSVEEAAEVRHRQESRGRPGANTRYRRLTRIHHQVRFSVPTTSLPPTPDPMAAGHSSPTTARFSVLSSSSSTSTSPASNAAITS